MKILVCGGREFGRVPKDKRLIDYEQRLHEYKFIMTTLFKLTVKHSKLFKSDDNWLPTDITIISGAASGADTVAMDFAIVHYCKLWTYKAEWKKYGMAAGFERNRRMLEHGKPDLVVAFPGNRGTAMMVRLAREAGVPVEEFTLPSSPQPSPGTSDPSQTLIEEAQLDLFPLL